MLDKNIESIVAEQKIIQVIIIDFTEDKIERELSLICAACKKIGLVIPYQRMKRKCMSFTSNLHHQAMPKYHKTKSFHLPCSCRCQRKEPPGKRTSKSQMEDRGNSIKSPE